MLHLLLQYLCDEESTRTIYLMLEANSLLLLFHWILFQVLLINYV